MKANTDEELTAGTGFMLQLREGLRHVEDLGYVYNWTPRYDHFEGNSGAIKLEPEEFVVDGLMRFENTSDPDDQSILYAISSKDGRYKGTYIESYGLYHDDLSPEMLERFKHCANLNIFE